MKETRNFLILLSLCLVIFNFNACFSSKGNDENTENKDSSSSINSEDDVEQFPSLDEDELPIVPWG